MVLPSWRARRLDTTGVAGVVRTRCKIVALGVALAALYLAAWPVPLEPVAREPPADPGFTGAFARNDKLADLEVVRIGAHEGPEDIAADAVGRLYMATHDGTIVRTAPDGSAPEDFAKTGGQDPSGAYPMTTGVLETDTHPWNGSLIAPHAARLPSEAVGLR